MKEEIGSTRIGGNEVKLYISTYPSGDIAVFGHCTDGIPWGTLTKYVDGLEPGEVAADTNNDWDYPSILESTGLFAKTSKTLRSGFCTYPVYLYMG